MIGPSSGRRSPSVQPRTEGGAKASAGKRGAFLLKVHLSAQVTLAQISERLSEAEREYLTAFEKARLLAGESGLIGPIPYW